MGYGYIQWSFLRCTMAGLNSEDMIGILLAAVSEVVLLEIVMESEVEYMKGERNGVHVEILTELEVEDK